VKIDTATLKGYCDAYGVAVRAGLLTPNPDDEAFVRKMFGLPEMNVDVRRSWQEAGGTRSPITIQPEGGEDESLPESDSNQEADE